MCIDSEYLILIRQVLKRSWADFYIENYDFHVSIQWLLETWFWILGWCLSLLTVAGNGFIIYLVWSKRQLRTKTNVFVVSLAVARTSVCVAASVVPPMFFCEMATGCNPQSYWISFVRWLFGYASVINLCVLVLDRYIAVVKPLKYLTAVTRRRVIQTISLSWGIRVAYSIFCALNWRIFKVSLVFDIVFWFDVIFLEFLPCLVLIFCIASTCRVVRKQYRTSRTTAKQSSFNHRVLLKIQGKSAIKSMAAHYRLVFTVLWILHSLFASICSQNRRM